MSSVPPPLASPLPRKKPHATWLFTAVLFLAIGSAGCSRSDSSGKAAAVSTAEPEKPGQVKTRMPDWVPLYPGSVLASDVTVDRSPQELSYGADFSTRDLCNVAISWYRGKLRSLGFKYGGMDVHMSAPVCESADNSPDAANGNSGQVTAESGDHQRTLSVSWYRRSFPKGNSEQVMNLVHLAAVERNHGAAPEAFGGRAQPQIPDWAPIYPGAAPELSGVQSDSSGTTIRFGFSTGDSCSGVIDWYDQRLKASGFHTFDRVDDQSRKDGCDSRISGDGGGRSIKIRAVTYSFNVHVDIETVQK